MKTSSIKIPSIKTGAAILAAALLPLAAAPAAAETRAEKNEAYLAKMLEGRVAGEPTNCIFAPRSHELNVIEYVGIVYDDGETIYVARTQSPHSLDYNDALIIERHGSSLCRHDITRTFDRTSHIPGIGFFDEFVPYTKVDAG